MRIGDKVDKSAPIFHFSHANGYAPRTYSQFLKFYQASHQVIASQHKPLWRPELDPEATKSWQSFSDDILLSLGTLDGPVTSVGHSMGSAAITMAAAQRPEHFRQLVLIEPVLVPSSYYLMLRLFGKHAANRVPLVSRTLNRVDNWDSAERCFAHFRPKSVFKKISDEGLWDYVNHGTFSDEEGRLRLVYSKEWEARCYLLVHNVWKQLAQMRIPVLIIRAGDSNTFSAASMRKLQKMAPQHSYLEIPDAGHLLPFEQPQRLAQEISAWLASQPQ
ncbi:MAG: pimeloyl-ACP methyl ester carboxylesterase [Pseudohongiellaceae bacterium]